MNLSMFTNLFDLEWYLNVNPDIAAANIDPVEHWKNNWAVEKRSPIYLFDVKYYLSEVENLESGSNPLEHYLAEGGTSDISPSLYFDQKWYRQRYHREIADSGLTPIEHFLINERSGLFDPNELFQTAYYLRSNPDIRSAEIAPYRHFVETGVFENRNPSEDFDVKFYVRRNKIPTGNSAFQHYLMIGAAKNLPRNKNQDKSVYSDHLRNTQPNTFFLPEIHKNQRRSSGDCRDVDLFAYYLPQFHPVEVNDDAWGKGFTEWTNIARGVPRFEGHIQPKIPRDLGFYDLRNIEVIEEQIKLAKMAELTGFCFYYYNFGGEKLLDIPLDNFKDLKSDFKFFLLWANENWTRTWDGFDKNLIKAQTYDRASLDSMAADLAGYMQEGNYYKLQGRPLFVIYRPGIIPDAINYLATMRKLLAERTASEPLIFMAQGFGDEDPRKFGLDGAIEFPPHKLAKDLPTINENLKFYDAGYEGSVVNYHNIIQRSLEEAPPAFPLIKTVFPGWDNEPRRPGRGTTFHGSTPDAYGRWLNLIMKDALKRPVYDKPIVAINAWNEWCEGAYLEPDTHFGHAYLQATLDARYALKSPEHRTGVLLVGHDAHPHGAQILLKNMCLILKSRGHKVFIILLNGGSLEAEYSRISNGIRICRTTEDVAHAIPEIAAQGYRICITNTVVSGMAVRAIKQSGLSIVSLIHEMENLIRERNLSGCASQIATYSDKIVFPAQIVRDDFVKLTGCPPTKLCLNPQGLYRTELLLGSSIFDRKKGAVCNIGFADLRKGYDIFVAAAREAEARAWNLQFHWIGSIEASLEAWLRPLPKNFKHIPFVEDIGFIAAKYDALLLTSREDPFPSTALEAAACGLPIVAISQSGGIADLVESNPELGAVVSADATASQMLDVLAKVISEDTKHLRYARSERMRRDYSFTDYMATLLRLAEASSPEITAVVPNYNYANYLHDRVSSVVEQTYAASKIVLLDDCSTDNSVEVITNIVRHYNPLVIPRMNESNSGSTFEQWRRGSIYCSSKYTWIAEADDTAESDFLELMIAAMEGCDANFAFSNSSQIDSDGNLLADNYDYYYRGINAQLFADSFVMQGHEFIRSGLGVKNPILNVSSVVWRTEALLKCLDLCQIELKSLKVCGDWLLYIQACALEGAMVCYIKEPLNHHRRHAGSATHAQKKLDQIREIDAVHKKVLETLSIKSDVDEVRHKQVIYLDELKRQFGLV